MGHHTYLFESYRYMQWSEEKRKNILAGFEAVSPTLKKLVGSLLSTDPFAEGATAESVASAYEKAFEHARSRFEAAEKDDSVQVLKKRWPSWVCLLPSCSARITANAFRL